MNNVSTYIKSIVVPLAIGTIVGLLISDFMDYGMLIKPTFAPPGILFPIVWTILYALMGVSYGLLKSNGLVNSKINLIYYSRVSS